MNQKEIKEIMKGTCFGSLAYCCGLKKYCDSRNIVLNKLGLSKEDFLKLKNKFDKELFKLLKNKNGNKH